MHKRIALSLVLALSVVGCDDSSSDLSIAPRRGSISVSPRALSASFVDDESDPQIFDYSARSVGDCVVQRWRTGPEGSGGRDVSAGTLTASGVESCSVGDDGEYFCEAALFDGATPGTVTVTASGGEVPAFSVEVATPVRPELTVPPTARASEDLVLRWTGGSGRVLAGGTGWVVGEDEDVRNVAVMCEVDAEAGELTVPASVLAELLAEAQGEHPTQNMWVGAVERETVTAGDYEIEVIAQVALGALLVGR